jgi:hypothetical protein
MQPTVDHLGRLVKSLMLGSGLLLGACHSADEATPGKTPAPSKATTAAVVGLTPAVSESGTLPVELRFGLQDPPTPGPPFTLSLVVATVNAEPALRVRVRGDDGLDVEGPATLPIERLAPGSPQTLAVTLRAANAGIHLVSVDVALDLAVDAPTRSFQFPVLVTAR